MSSLHTISYRIQQRMKQLNIKNKDIVEATKASKGAISLWVNGETGPSSQYLPALAKVLRVSEDWLINGGLLKNDNAGFDNKIPIISEQQAYEWNEILSGNINTTFNEWLNVGDDISSSSFAYKIKGDSMLNTTGYGPSIPEGSFIIIDPDIKPKSEDLVVARLKDTNNVTFKRLVIDGPNLYLMPLNQRYRPINIENLDDIIGVCKRIQIDLF